MIFTEILGTGSYTPKKVLKNKDLSEFTLNELKEFDKSIENDVFEVISLEGSIRSRNHIGGTSPEQILIAIKAGRNAIK